MDAPRPDLRNPVHFLAFGFGSGLSPLAPGTMGTLVAIPICLLMQYISFYSYIAVLSTIIIFGIWLCGRSSRLLGVHDHGGIVWDEIAGYLLTMTAVPINLWTVLAGFVLFRLFDIAKPWPIGWLDRRLQGGLGIMLDDIVAGGFALAILHLLLMWEILPAR